MRRDPGMPPIWLREMMLPFPSGQAESIYKKRCLPLMLASSEALCFVVLRPNLLI